MLYAVAMVKPPNKAFLEAIDVFGTEAAMSRAIDKPAQFINQIKKGERPMPDAWAPLIEDATAQLGSRIFCENLAPDFRWDVVRGTAATPAQKAT